MGSRLAADGQIVEVWISAGTPMPVGTPAATAEERVVRRTVPFSTNTTAQELVVNEPAYFYQLMNIEDHAEFLADARLLAEH